MKVRTRVIWAWVAKMKSQSGVHVPLDGRGTVMTIFTTQHIRNSTALLPNSHRVTEPPQEENDNCNGKSESPSPGGKTREREEIQNHK